MSDAAAESVAGEEARVFPPQDAADVSRRAVQGGWAWHSLLLPPILFFQTLYVSFVACEVPPRQLRSESHDSVEDRIRVENSHIDLLSIGKD